MLCWGRIFYAMLRFLVHGTECSSHDIQCNIDLSNGILHNVLSCVTQYN
jgi:hypothetical protein